MATERIHGAVTFMCDTCENVLETGEKEWTDAKAALDGAGWKARKVAGEWCHFCDDCGDRS